MIQITKFIKDMNKKQHNKRNAPFIPKLIILVENYQNKNKIAIKEYSQKNIQTVKFLKIQKNIIIAKLISKIKTIF